MEFKEKLIRFIDMEQAINERLKNESSNDDRLMNQFIKGKESVLERLENLLLNL